MMPKPPLYALVIATALALAAAGCHQESRDDYMVEGIQLLSEGNAKGAVVVFKNLLEKYPADNEARFELAKAYLETGKFDQAENELSNLAAGQNPPGDLKLVLGKVKLAQAKPDQALAELTAYAQANQNSAEVWDFIARGHIAKLNLPLAAADYEHALSLDPDRVSSKLGLIETRFALGQADQGDSILDDLLKTNPNNQPGLHILAKRQTEKKDLPAAIATYDKLVAKYPKDLPALYGRDFLILTSQGVSADVDKDVAQIIKDFPNRPEGYKLRGMADYLRASYPEAANNFQRAIKLGPQLDSHYMLALAYEHTGDLEMAISELQVVLDHAPKAIQARQLLASLHFRLHRVDEAIAELDKILQMYPNDDQSKRMLGDIYMANQNYDKSLEMFGSISANSDQASVAHLKIGIIDAAEGKTADAEPELRKAVELGTGKLEPRLILATYLSRQQRVDEALAVLDMPDPAPTTAALICNAKANILSQHGRLDEAKTLLEKAKDLNPSLLSTYFNLASLYLRMKEPDQAQEQYGQILGLKPDSPDAHTAMANLLERAGKFDQAETHLRKAVESKRLNTYLNLAAFLSRRNKPQEAIKALDMCLDEHKLALPALLFKSQLLFQAGDEAKSLAVIQQMEAVNPKVAASERLNHALVAKKWDEAEKVASKMVLDNPSSGDSYLPLANVKEQKGDDPGALEVLGQALAADKSNLRVQLRTGALLTKMGKYQEAQAYFDKLIAANPKLASAYAYRGLNRQLGQDQDAAVKDYEAALTLDKNNLLALNNLAVIYAEKPELAPTGLTYAMSAFALNDQDPAILDTLGYLMLKNGRTGDAATLLKRAAGMYPKDKSIAEHLKMADSQPK